MPGAAETEATKDLSVRGRAAYLRYCSSCHGNEAHGDGARASGLKVPVPDLTRIAARNGGAYDYDGVVRSIMKGSEGKGHGTEGMPAWGRAFSGTNGMAAMVTAVRDLAHYLRSVQRP